MHLVTPVRIVLTSLYTISRKMTTSARQYAETDRLMEMVYGKISHADFPKSFPKTEAGDSVTGKRRYLWTDAFGVLNYVALSEAALEHEHADKSRDYLNAASKLIDDVFNTLGAPKSASFPMQKRAIDGGYKGLRIGKVQSKIMTDNGMTFDGMYWHYLDKFIFALLRFYSSSGDTTALVRATQLIQDLHPAFFVPGAGYRWKVNVDLSSIPGAGVSPSHDCVSAWVVFNIAKALGADVSSEIDDLTPLVQA
jgi:hypothetical protein